MTDDRNAYEMGEEIGSLLEKRLLKGLDVDLNSMSSEMVHVLTVLARCGCPTCVEASGSLACAFAAVLEDAPEHMR